MLLYCDVEHVWWRHCLTELFSLIALMRSMKNSLRGPPPSTALSHRKVTWTCFLSSKVHFTAQRASSHMLLLRTRISAHTCRPTINANNRTFGMGMADNTAAFLVQQGHFPTHDPIPDPPRGQQTSCSIENRGHLSSIKADSLILFEVNTCR